MKWQHACAWLCAVGTPPVGASADALISNLSAGIAPAGTFFGANSGTSSKAMGMTIGPQAYTLTSVSLSMNYGIGGVAVVSIWSGAGTPQTRLQTLSAPSQSGSGVFSFTPSSTLTLAAGQTYWVYVESVPSPSGSFMWEGTSPNTAPTGAATFAGSVYNGSPSATYNRLSVVGTLVGAPCYPNCDGSSVAPVLTANDFQCFIDRYVAGTSYANCDGSTVAPVLTANDFQCFINKYVAGCT